MVSLLNLPLFMFWKVRVPVKLPYGYVLAGKEITAHEEKQMLSAVYLNTILLEPA